MMIAYTTVVVFAVAFSASAYSWSLHPRLLYRRQALAPSSSRISMMSGDGLILDGLAAVMDKASRPAHVGVPRKRMDLQFAVLLMRSSYQIADDLDYFPMDEFQKSFFLFRQSEWEDYKGYHPTVLQGDLADPLYFDFISFAQYAVLDWSMKRGQMDFVEKVGAEGETIVVKRDPKYANNKLLPEVHSTMVGDRILDTFYEKYPASILPPANATTINSPSSLTCAKFVGYLQMLLDVFSINSFSLNTELTILPSASPDGTEKAAVNAEALPANSVTVRILLRAPANLWSQQTLIRRKSTLLNDFEIKTLAAYARRFGVQLVPISTTVVNSIDVVHIVRLQGLNAASC